MLASALTVVWLAALVIVVTGVLRLVLHTAVGGWLLLADRRRPGPPNARAPNARTRAVQPARRAAPGRTPATQARAAA